MESLKLNKLNWPRKGNNWTKTTEFKTDFHETVRSSCLTNNVIIYLMKLILNKFLTSLIFIQIYLLILDIQGCSYNFIIRIIQLLGKFLFYSRFEKCIIRLVLYNTSCCSVCYHNGFFGNKLFQTVNFEQLWMLLVCKYSKTVTYTISSLITYYSLQYK